MAKRIAISRWRSRACARRKLARLAHATTSTSATTTINADAAGTTMLSMSGLTAIDERGMTRMDICGVQSFGFSRRISETNRVAVACAEANDWPSARRALAK